MKRFRFQFPKGVATLLGLAWLGVTTTAIAEPFPVYLPTRIDWVLDFPFVPSTVSGISTVSTDARPYQFLPTEFNDENPVGLGSTWVPSPPSGYYLIFAGETILWSLGGSLSYGDFTFPFCAYSDSAAIPTEPCNPSNAPMIPIATIPSAQFDSFSVTGPVFAFDATVQIGTWVIFSDHTLIPEPATLALLAIGAAGLGTLRRRG